MTVKSGRTVDDNLKAIAEKHFDLSKTSCSHLDARNWPSDLGKAFDNLTNEQQEILRALAKDKVPPSYNQALDYLKKKEVGWIEENKNKNGWSISNEFLKQFILYKRTDLYGWFRLLKDRRFCIFKLDISLIHRFGLKIASGFILLFLPLFLAMLLTYPTIRELLTQFVQQINIGVLNTVGESQIANITNLTIFASFTLTIYATWISVLKKRRNVLEVMLIAILLLLLWLGVSWTLALLLFVFFIADFLAFHEFFNAYEFAEPYKERFDFKFPYKFLEGLITWETWKNPKSWPQPKIIVFMLLFITGFFLFTYALTPLETVLNTPIFTEDKDYNSKDDLFTARVYYPAWLSEGDNGNLTVQLNNSFTKNLTITFNLEPAPGHLLHIIPEKENPCASICQIMIPANNQTVLQWRIHSLPQNPFIQETKWRVRYKICEDLVSCTDLTDAQQIVISKLRLGFSLWGAMENQPLVTIMSIVASMIYVLVEIGMSSVTIPFKTKGNHISDRKGEHT